jgi:hypothetical protein
LVSKELRETTVGKSTEGFIESKRSKTGIFFKNQHSNDYSGETEPPFRRKLSLFTAPAVLSFCWALLLICEV